jgi:two-component system, sensor histidine kinase RegB
MPWESARTALGGDRAGCAIDLPRCFMQGATVHNLRLLVLMRNVAIVGQAVTLVVVDRGLGLALPMLPMAAVILALAALNAATWHRLRSGRPVTDAHLAVQLLVDIAALTAQLAMAGGAANPFVGMYLLPLAITAASLPWTFTWSIALVTIACHSMLVYWFRPLFAAGEEVRQVQLLTAGMWINYVVTAGMVAWFLLRSGEGLRASERALAEAREREIRNEHIVRIGTLAAGAAHELAQPMATMTLLMSELESHSVDKPEMRELVEPAAKQLGRFREMLGELLTYGRDRFDPRTEVTPIDTFLRTCVDLFRTRRPGVAVTLAVDSSGPAPGIRHDIALRQAILALLGNAADVSPLWVELHASWDDEYVTVAVLDRGPGIPPHVAKRVGKIFFTTKPAGSGAGTGLGLALAHTAVSRLGGALELANAPEGGARAQIVLPIDTPATPAESVTTPEAARARRA